MRFFFGILLELRETTCELVSECTQSLRLKRKASPKRPTDPLEVRRLPDRITPATDIWVAPAGPAVDFAVGTAWSLGHSPAQGDNVVYQTPNPGQGIIGSDTACVVSANDVIPQLNTLTFKPWAGTLTLNSDVASNQIMLNPRTANAGNSEVIINSGSHLFSLQTLSWTGGNVSGSGDFVTMGNATIFGGGTDQPTLGSQMDVGGTYLNNPYASGMLVFSPTSTPLIVQSNAQISVNSGSTLMFMNQAAMGQNQATAISNGDTLSHSLIVNGGTVTRTNSCELFVCMGLDVESGQVNVSNPGGQNTGNPLHFTGQNADGTGLNVSGGAVNLNGDMTADAGGNIEGGTVTIAGGQGGGAKLTLGINANSPWSELNGSGNLVLQGTLIAHGGGFSMYGGTLNSAGASGASVILDTGSTFYLNGGEIDITDPDKQSATGVLHLLANLSANGGKIVDNVNSSDGTHGWLDVIGNATLTKDTIFSSLDLNQNAKNVDRDWLLMTLKANPQGDFTYDLPQNWIPKPWNNGILYIHEP